MASGFTVLPFLSSFLSNLQRLDSIKIAPRKMRRHQVRVQPRRREKRLRLLYSVQPELRRRLVSLFSSRRSRWRLLVSWKLVDVVARAGREHRVVQGRRVGRRHDRAAEAPRPGFQICQLLRLRFLQRSSQPGRDQSTPAPPPPQTRPTSLQRRLRLRRALFAILVRRYPMHRLMSSRPSQPAQGPPKFLDLPGPDATDDVGRVGDRDNERVRAAERAAGGEEGVDGCRRSEADGVDGPGGKTAGLGCRPDERRPAFWQQRSASRGREQDGGGRGL